MVSHKLTAQDVRGVWKEAAKTLVGISTNTATRIASIVQFNTRAGLALQFTFFINKRLTRYLQGDGKSSGEIFKNLEIRDLEQAMNIADQCAENAKGYVAKLDELKGALSTSQDKDQWVKMITEYITLTAQFIMMREAIMALAVLAAMGQDTGASRTLAARSLALSKAHAPVNDRLLASPLFANGLAQLTELTVHEVTTHGRISPDVGLELVNKVLGYCSGERE